MLIPTTKSLVRVPQGKICRLEEGKGYDGLYTDDFSSCNIVILQGEERISMIHADPSTYESSDANSMDVVARKINQEKCWIEEKGGYLSGIYVFYKPDGKVIFDVLKLGLEKIISVQPVVDAEIKSVTAVFGRAPQGSKEKLYDGIVRHPQEIIFETVHKINVGFFYLLGFSTQEQQKQWASEMAVASILVFDGEFWLQQNSKIHPSFEEKIAPYRKKKDHCDDKDLVNDIGNGIRQIMTRSKQFEQDTIQKISSSLAETIFCFFCERVYVSSKPSSGKLIELGRMVKLHLSEAEIMNLDRLSPRESKQLLMDAGQQVAVAEERDAKALNRAYDQIKQEREALKKQINSFYKAEKWQELIDLLPNIVKVFSREEVFIKGVKISTITLIQEKKVFFRLLPASPAPNLVQTSDDLRNRLDAVSNMYMPDDVSNQITLTSPSSPTLGFSGMDYNCATIPREPGLAEERPSSQNKP